MKDIPKKPAVKLWGDVLASRFVRLPFELLVHYKEIGLSETDLIVVMWIAFHQWTEKAAFPHPVKLAFVLKVSESEAVNILKDLEARGFLTLERTENNSRNYHQDIRLTRNKLRSLVTENPDHCEVIKRKNDPKGIDTSVKKLSPLTDTSNSKDTSILQDKNNRGGTSSLGDVINKKKKKG